MLSINDAQSMNMGERVTTVSGSFDHRVVDGDGISRFIADVASVLPEPALLLD